eukprot:scaffold95257_cov37-Tisochrysis_lutea.AAC.1
MEVGVGSLICGESGVKYSVLYAQVRRSPMHARGQRYTSDLIAGTRHQLVASIMWRRSRLVRPPQDK